MKIIKVESCKSCPYLIDTLDHESNQIDACYFGHIKVDDGTKIADFCPLEDYQSHLGECNCDECKKVMGI